MFVGPKLNRDGLILSLDGGTERSFKGEPTVNLRTTESNGQYARSNYQSGVWTYNGIQTSGLFTGWEMITATRTSTANNLIMFLNGITATANTTYTTSMEFFAPYGNLQFTITGNQGVGLLTRIGDSYRYFRTWTKNATTSGQHLYLIAPGLAANQDITNGIIYYRRVQWEQRDFLTPWVNGTRGNTVATGGGWADISGNSNHASLQNEPRFTDIASGVLTLDGVASHFNLVGNTQWGVFANSSFTLRAVIRPQNIGTPQAIISQRHGDAMSLFILANGKVTLEMDDTQNYVGTNTTLVNNNWYDITVVFTSASASSAASYYINGVFERSETKWDGNGITNNTSLWIGWQSRTDYAVNPGYFQGNIACIQVYNRALSDLEISQNFSAIKGRIGL